MKDLIFNPNLFFSEKSKNEVNFKYPILIILLNSIIVIISIILTLNKLKDSFNFDGNFPASFLIVGGAIVSGLVMTFASWFITTGIFYGVSSLFNSKGSFKRTLEFVGYGYVPKIFNNLVSFFVSYVTLSSIDNLQNPQLITANLGQTYLIPEQIIGILCLLLAAYIWIFALLHARNMSTKNAILTVGVPVGLYLIYLIFMLYLLTSHALNV